MGLRNRGPKANPIDARFIGRENILEDFAREWNKSIDESRRFIVNLFGLGGIGKSKLLQQFLLRHAQEEMVCKFDANFDELNDPLAVIKTILRKTRHTDKQIEFEETQELIARFEKLVNEAAKSSGESPGAITKLLIKGAQIGGELLGGTETGKTVREVGDAAADLVEIGLEKLASVWRTAKDEKDAKLLDAPVREITDKLVEEINGHCKDNTRFILAIDTYEKIPPSVDRWLLKDLLVEHEEQIKFDLRLLVAGREPLTEVNRHWHDEWGGELLAFKVEPFTLEETSALLLQRRDIADPQIIEKIHNSTRGYPFWLDLWANSGIDPEHFFSTGHLQKIEDRLFEMFPNPKHQNWLRQAAFFYRFNQDLLAILIKDDVDKAFEWLVGQSSVVEGSGKYWKLHDVARKIILTNLRNRSQALLAEPAGKILQHFQQQLQNPWEKWRDLRLRLILSEQDLQVISEISYYQALAHAEIADDNLDMIVRASDYSIKTARNLFNLACDALNDIDSILPEKFTFAQGLIETVSGELKEDDLDEKKSKLLKHSFSDYQKAILLNRVAKVYGNKLKQIEKALICFGEIFALYLDYESALMAKALLISDNNPELALRATNIVIANNPNHQKAIFRLAYCYNKLGRYDDSINQIQKVIAIDPQDKVAYASWAWSLIELGRHEEAVEKNKKAIEIDPKYVDAYHNLGFSLGKLGRNEEAIVQFKKIIEIDPKYVWAYNSWGNRLRALGRHQEAIEQYTKAIEIDPNFVVAYDNWGSSLYKLGRYEEAIEQYKKILEIDPKYLTAYKDWGLSLGKLDRHEEAIEKYKKAIEIDPKYVAAYNAWGNRLTDLGHYEEAIEQYKKATEIDPKFVLAYDNWSLILGRVDRHDEAIEQCKKIIEIDPKYIVAYNRWGWNLGKLNRHKEALDYYKKAIEIDPKFVQAYHNWGWSLGKLGHHDEAIEQIKRAIEIDLKDTWAYNAWGNRLRDLGQYEEAIEQYNKAIEIDPKYSQAYSNWADSLRVLGRYQEAIERYGIAIELDPKSRWDYNYRGLVYSYMGEMELAMADYAKALEIDSNSLSSCYNMAILKKKLNHADASLYVEKLQSLGSNKSKTDDRVLYRLAGLAAMDGEFDTALETLRQAANQDFRFAKENAQIDLAFESIRNIPEFQAIFRIE